MARPLSERQAHGGDKRSNSKISNPYEPVPTIQMGDPVISLTDAEERMFFLFRDKQLIKGVAFESDNYSLCQLAKLAAKDEIGKLTYSGRTELFRLLSAFGLMPSARRLVEQRDENGNRNAGFSGLFNGKPDLKVIKNEKVKM